LKGNGGRMSDLILGIETSCDETAAAVIKDGKFLLSNIVASQVDWHKKYGGVVPEIASRKHLEFINPVIDQALTEAEIEFEDLAGVAVTYGPGLVGGLLVGIAAAKAIAYAHSLPLIAVNHIEGHIYANLISHPKIKPPVVCLTVSGGHTDLLYFSEFGDYEILGRSRDDAAGEAFDKVAKVLEIGYPGGPAVETLARQGDENAIDFPRPMIHTDNYDFSFSGLKTAVLNYINQQRQKNNKLNKANIAASFQKAAIDVLVKKIVKAVKEKQVDDVLLAGGVSANQKFRELLRVKLNNLGVNTYYPNLNLCTDNAAMIASAGYFKWKKTKKRALYSLNAEPNLKLN